MTKTASGLSQKLLRPVRDERQEWEQHADRGAEFEARGERSQWEAKTEYETAAALGASTRDVARRVGKSHVHIHRLLTMVNRVQAEEMGLSFAEAYAKAKEKKPKEHAGVRPLEVPTGTFATVVIDPPWQYDNRGTRGAANDHYPTMAIDELASLDVPAAPEAHLYLWTTNAFLRDAFDLVDAWEFDYKATLVWAKPQIGMGNYFRICHELVLFAIRGGLGTLRKDARSWFEAPRGKHSAKPDAFYDLVESCSPGPYLDMFNRDGGKLFRRAGWEGWGNEA